MRFEYSSQLTRQSLPSRCYLFAGMGVDGSSKDRAAVAIHIQYFVCVLCFII